MPDPDSSRSDLARRCSPHEWLQIDVVEEDGDWLQVGPVGALIAEATQALACHPRFRGRAPASACIALSDNATVRRLNKAYRGQDKPTNVLSFPAISQALAGPAGTVPPLGDIVLAFETVMGEAREQGVLPQHHLQHLVVHGLLHLMGFDHVTSEDAAAMEAIEVEILASAGIANPYEEPVAPQEGQGTCAP